MAIALMVASSCVFNACGGENSAGNPCLGSPQPGACPGPTPDAAGVLGYQCVDSASVGEECTPWDGSYAAVIDGAALTWPCQAAGGHCGFGLSSAGCAYVSSLACPEVPAGSYCCLDPQ